MGLSCGRCCAALLGLLALGVGAAEPPLRLRAVGVPGVAVSGPQGESLLRVMDAFVARHPHVTLLPATGIVIPGRSMDTQPLMQIAGDVSPDVIYVNFRQSDTYIRNKFLHPLDRYYERTAGVELPDGHLLATDDYYAALRGGAGFDAEMKERLPRIVWDVIRRQCPYGAACPHLAAWGRAPAARHQHVWTVPQNQQIMALFYRRDVFAEAGLPDRVPETLDEMLSWARQIANPKENLYGIAIPTAETGWSTLSILYSFQGRAVSQDSDGAWRCVFDSEQAVAAYTFVARMFLEPFENRHGRFSSPVDTGDLSSPGIRRGMWFSYLDQKAMAMIDPDVVGFGPVPRGPDGIRGSEYNCMMHGIYAGSARDARLRDMAWEYMWFYGGNEANAILAKVFVENGLGRFVRPAALRAAGYGDEADAVPAGWEAANTEALAAGVPEPYGRNCQLVYTYISRAIDQLRNDARVRHAIAAGDDAAARARIAAILKARVAIADEKMIGRIAPATLRVRRRVAAIVVVAIFLLFTWLFRRVGAAFTGKADRRRDGSRGGGWQAGRRKLAWLLLLPALLSIAVWSYYPLARGTLMAFQDYNVRGFSEWVGFDNFATVLFNAEFWHSLGVSLKYALLYMTFGFAAPIVLAFLLAEAPRGKIFFRTIYYLPAVLSGVVVIFLWKGFYGAHGMVNQLLNRALHLVNALCGTAYADVATNWLSSPDFALLFCLLPTIWAGMGPGCLIYLAALKTVPDDLYEAAEIEGAGAWAKVRHIALPSIRTLIGINFLGAMIGAMKSGGEFVLAMTGGGPYAPYGKTEVVGLHIFWEAFGFLRFGTATAMAWVLGSLLIGFTVMRLRSLSRMEFRTVGR